MTSERKRLEVRTKARNVLLKIGKGLGGDPEQIDASLVYRKSDYLFTPLAFACAPAERCRIQKDSIGEVSVWVGSAAFEVAKDQALLVHKALGIPATDDEGNPL